MPSVLAAWFPDQPFLSIRALNALACSMGRKSSRKQFSTSWRARSSPSSRGSSETTQDMVAMPAILAARQRRSPQMRAYLLWASSQRTRIGWSWPRVLSESASRSSDSGSNSSRGWSGLGTILSSGTSIAFLLLATPCQRAGVVEVCALLSPRSKPAPMLSAMFAPPLFSRSSSFPMSGGLLPGVPGFWRAAETCGDLLGECLHRLGGNPARLVERDRLALNDRFLEVSGDRNRGRKDRRTVEGAEELLEALVHGEPVVGHGDQEA